MTGSTNVLARRAVAHLIDTLVVIVAASLPAAITGDDSGGGWFVLWILFTLGVAIPLQGLTGYTPAKRLLGILS